MITEKELLNNRKEICKQLGVNRIYTIHDFREMFNISYPYVYKLMRQGEIPKFRGKIGRFSFFTDEEVQQVRDSGLLNHKLLLERG